MIKIENTTLADFEPAKIKEHEAQRAEDQKIMDFLGRFTADMLKDALRGTGHPKSEWGDGETWRSYYLDECRRRGTKLLHQLGWPVEEGSFYVNIYTGSIEQLIDITTSYGYFAGRQTIASQVWSVIEHWEPYDPNKPNLFRIKYLEKELEELQKIKAREKLDAIEKSEVKNILLLEKEIQSEKLKHRGDHGL